MAKLADLLAHAENNSTQSARSMEWYVRFAYTLGMNLDRAQALFREHGCGQIYSATGFVMEDSEHMRQYMIRHFDRCVLVNSEGDMQILSKLKSVAQERAKRRTIQRHRAVKVREERIAERQERTEARKRERIFHEGMGHPSPKKQGKADSLGDIGKYAWNPRQSVSDLIPKSLGGRGYIYNIG